MKQSHVACPPLVCCALRPARHWLNRCATHTPTVGFSPFTLHAHTNRLAAVMTYRNRTCCNSVRYSFRPRHNQNLCGICAFVANGLAPNKLPSQPGWPHLVMANRPRQSAASSDPQSADLCAEALVAALTRAVVWGSGSPAPRPTHQTARNNNEAPRLVSVAEEALTRRV